MTAKTAAVTRERLKELLHYEPKTGEFTWIKYRMGRMRPGDEAGGFNVSGMIMIGVDGKLYPAARLAWLYKTGEWPKSKIKFRNGDHHDLRFENLQDERTSVPPTRSAWYQRRWRAIRKWVDAKIKADPALYQEWLDDPITTEYLLRTERKEYLAQNGFDDET